MPNETLIGLVAPYNDDVSAQEVFNLLSAKTIIEKTVGVQNYKTITLTYGPEFAATVLGKLKIGGDSNPLLDATYYAMCGEGIDFSLDVTQGLITQLTGVLFTEDEASKLAWLGVQKYSLLEKNNLTEVSVQDVQDAITAKISRRDNFSWFVNIYNTVVPQLQDGTITRQQVKDMVNA